MRRLIGAAVGLLAAVSCAHAGELHVIINGRSIHLDDRTFNETNTGLGFEYDFEPRERWRPLINAATFRDSNDNTSNYLGAGLKRRLLGGRRSLHLDAGALAFVMTRQDFRDNQPFPGVLPFVSVGNRHVAVNAAYVPRTHPKLVELVYFQLMIRAAEF